jgi:exonuclease SbcC
MGAAPAAAATPASQPAVDVAADQAEFERRQRVAADAEAVEQEELRIKHELERREHDLEAAASRAAAEAAREQRVAASLEAQAQSEHEQLRREEEELKLEQRELRRVYSADLVPDDINDPTCLTTAYYQMDRDADLQELQSQIDAERQEVEREKQLVAERDAAAQAELAKARQLQASADHAQSDADAVRRQVEREARLLESQHRVVVADETEALQAQRKAATNVFQQLFDTERSGSVSLSKLHHRLSDFGHREHEIELLCHSLGSTADGMVTLEHFVQGYPRYHSLMD